MDEKTLDEMAETMYYILYGKDEEENDDTDD